MRWQPRFEPDKRNATLTPACMCIDVWLRLLLLQVRPQQGSLGHLLPFVAAALVEPRLHIHRRFAVLSSILFSALSGGGDGIDKKNASLCTYNTARIEILETLGCNLPRREPKDYTLLLCRPGMQRTCVSSKCRCLRAARRRRSLALLLYPLNAGLLSMLRRICGWIMGGVWGV